ncbi:MAG: hypothetical protein MUF41_07255 [Sphingopyxis sp.]|nr:hypothetical protein [Sphingopyxis sp.]
MSMSITATLGFLLLAAQADQPAPAAPSAPLAGTWSVDLRLSESDPVYTQPMELVIAMDGTVSGSFYGSPITAGRFGENRGRRCVAFSTSDGAGPYQHAACLVDNRMIGQSWAEHRSFVLPWTADRPAPAAP